MHTESDWKKFSALVPVLRERYLQKQNARIAALLSAPNQTETERFWAAEKATAQTAQTLCACLDGHSRSKMWQFMLLMIRAGMLTQDDLAGFSPQLQESFAEDFAQSSRPAGKRRR